ncbi:MAG: hypothetical protein ACYC1Y_00015 [Minisyncoccota bacterium]
MNTHKTTRKRKEGVYKEEIFLKFIEWLAIPPKVRGATPEILSKNYGLPQDLFDQELLALRTQGKFAEYFNIGDPGTLSDWKKRIKREGRFKEQAEIKKWAQYLVPNVFFAFIQRALREGTARQMELYLKLVFDWDPGEGLRTKRYEDVADKELIAINRVISQAELREHYDNVDEVVTAASSLTRTAMLRREIREIELTIGVHPRNDHIPNRLTKVKAELMEAESRYRAALNQIRGIPNGVDKTDELDLE